VKSEKEKEKGEDGDAAKERNKLIKKCQRQFGFYVLSVGTQIVAALLCVLLLCWVIFQALRLINALGVSDVPPGLIYYTPP
jgi:hypothetical protein